MESYVDFYITTLIPRKGAATNHIILTSPVPVDLKSVTARYRVGSVNGAFGLVKAKSGTALEIANSPMLALVPLYGAPDVNQVGLITTLKIDSKVSTAQGYRIAAGTSLGLVFYYDLTGLEDLCITCVIGKVA